MYMLEQKTFLQGLKMLKMMYLNWNFDITNALAVGMWYKKFQDLDDNVFKALIEKYTDVSSFAPNSPSDILKYIEEYDSPEVAWEKILSVIKKSFNNINFLNNISKEYPNLYMFVQNIDIENVSLDDYGNKNYGYEYGRGFKRQYKGFLNSKKLVKINDTILLNGSSNDLMLESKGE